MAPVTVALAGNPNSGKTTLFNALTGSSQHVGNWPGVTVEKKQGRLRLDRSVVVTDLPGIYSLSPYSLEEVISRDYLVHDRPGAIVNLVDATNLERNLYLTTQVAELGIPTVVALNMIDLVGPDDAIDTATLARELGCPVVETSALRGTGIADAARTAIDAATAGAPPAVAHPFGASVERALDAIAERFAAKIAPAAARWFAVKLFERDAPTLTSLALTDDERADLEAIVVPVERELGDDAEAIITDERYAFVERTLDATRVKRVATDSVSDRIDRIVTNRFLALPIFAAVMFVMYYIAVTTVGTLVTDWTNDVLFGTWITDWATSGLQALGVAAWLQSLVVDGIINGVGTVLGFVPQMLLLFFFLALLEDSGYMARVAFIMDRVFRRFGLSGKSFIPMLIGTGCGVPAVMATRTIENEKDRRMTIMLSTFMPCSAKVVIISMITVTFFPGSALMAPAMYFLAIGVIIASGIAFKKTRYFGGDPAPFVMELPPYHVPAMRGVLTHMWERARAFVVKAGTIIFAVVVVVWFLSTFSFSMQMVDIEQSMTAQLGRAIGWLFSPLGFGDWKGAVATISALMAKESAIGTLAVLQGVADPDNTTQVMAGLAAMFTPMAAFSFMILNLFDPPCIVAMTTTAREMNSRRWTTIAIGYQVFLGYSMAFVAYQLGSALFYGAGFGAGQVIACLVVAAWVVAVVRPASHSTAQIPPARADDEVVTVP